MNAIASNFERLLAATTAVFPNFVAAATNVGRKPNLPAAAWFEAVRGVLAAAMIGCRRNLCRIPWRAAVGAILTLMMLFGVAKGQQPGPENGASRELLLAKINAITIPRIDFEDNTIKEAVDFLISRSIELDHPERQGINIVIQLPGGEEAADILRIDDLNIRNVPFSAALKYVCEATNLHYTVSDTAVILSPKPEAAADPPEPENNPAKELITKKLNSIFIPRIDFEDVSIAEAIDFIRQRAVELDVEEPDRARRGMNFIVRLPRSAVGEMAVAPLIRELRLRNVPLSSALTYICDATNLQYSVDEFGSIVISPLEKPE